MRFLMEMADSKSNIAHSLISVRDVLISHLIKVFVWKHSSSYTHWKHEIYNFVSRISKLKLINKYPSANFIFNNLFGNIKDVFKDRLEVYIDDINYDYFEDECSADKNKDFEPAVFDNLDTDKLLNFIEDYIKWLSINLSNSGVVKFSEVSSKIDSLLD